MANQNEVQEKLRLGIEAARRGDKQAAEVLLRQVVAADPRNELGWMWLASAVESVEERRACLERVLRINPNNTRAQEALRRLGGGATAPAAPRPTRRAIPRPTAEAASGRLTSGLSGAAPIVIGALVVVAIIGALVFGAVFTQQANILNPPTEVDPELAAAAAFNPSVTPSPDPATFTDTPTPFRVIVTLDPAQADLPPTFTPTFTPEPSATPSPTATPLPLSTYRLLYTSMVIGEAQADLYETLGDGTEDQRQAGNMFDVVYDPSGRRVAFVREVTVGGGEEGDAPRSATELFIAPVDDLSDAQQITELGSTISRPTWAPDGIQLAFSSDFDGDEEIWVITEDGQNLRQLTVNESIDRDPAWSPDGRTIIYASDQDTPGLTKIFSISATGDDEPVRLGVLGNSSFAPRWSSDGRLIAFVSDEQGDSDIYTMSADGSDPRLLTAGDGEAEDRSPAFTPDGLWVSFVSNRESENFQVYMVNISGTEIQRVTNSERDDQSLDVFPNANLRLAPPTPPTETETSD